MVGPHRIPRNIGAPLQHRPPPTHPRIRYERSFVPRPRAPPPRRPSREFFLAHRDPVPFPLPGFERAVSVRRVPVRALRHAVSEQMNYPGVNSGVSNKPPYPQSLSPDGGKGSRVIPAVFCPLRGKDVRRTARGLPFAEGNHVNPEVGLRGILSINVRVIHWRAPGLK